MLATFNARTETMAEKPMFRDSFKRRRCIIPASGFFEWTDEADGKQPHLFTAADGSPILAFAGLWDRWIDPVTKEEILSCTVIVSGASEWMTPYHDRMPVLLRAGDFDAWLNGPLGADALRPAAESALREWPVSRRVNRAGAGEQRLGHKRQPFHKLGNPKVGARRSWVSFAVRLRTSSPTRSRSAGRRH